MEDKLYALLEEQMERVRKLMWGLVFLDCVGCEHEPFFLVVFFW
jgi:hypothetical protein